MPLPVLLPYFLKAGILRFTCRTDSQKHFHGEGIYCEQYVSPTFCAAEEVNQHMEKDTPEG